MPTTTIDALLLAVMRNEIRVSDSWWMDVLLCVVQNALGINYDIVCDEREREREAGEGPFFATSR